MTPTRLLPNCSLNTDKGSPVCKVELVLIPSHFGCFNPNSREMRRHKNRLALVDSAVSTLTE